MNIIRIQRENSVGQDGPFTRKLTEHLKSKVRPAYARGKVIRPSDLTNCIRQVVADILGFPYDITTNPRQQRIFDNGNWVHKRYLEEYIPAIGNAAKILVQQRGQWVVSDFIEVKLEYEEYWLRGRPDAVIVNDEDGLPYVFELKSIKHEDFVALTQPSAGYIAQVHLYMFMIGIPRSIVFYESKNTQETKEFKIELDKELLNTILERIRTIQRFVLEYPTTKVLPFCEGVRNPCDCTKYHI